MNPKITLKGLVAITAIALHAQVLFAQWNQQTFGGNRWYRINTVGPGWTAVGVGNFSSANSPLAALHINSNLLTPSSNFNQGQVFRTDGPSNFANTWQMFTGGQTGGPAASEKFRLFVPPSSDNVFLRSSVPGANMQFQTTLTVFENLSRNA